MSENRVLLKLKNNVTSLSDIFWSELNWATYGVFVETGTARTMLGSIVNKQNLSWQGSGCWVLWCTHSAWNSNTAVYSSLCTPSTIFSLGLAMHALCLDPFCSTHKLFSSFCTLVLGATLALVWPRQMLHFHWSIRIDQSHHSKFGQRTHRQNFTNYSR